MEIRVIPVSSINPAPYNPRIDLQPGDKDYERLKKSIEQFGFIEPLVWNEQTGNLVGGHQRFKILTNELHLTEVEVSVVDLDEMQEKALNLALNKLKGGWDDDKLRELIAELDAEEYDLDSVGFSDEDVERLMVGFVQPEMGSLADLSEVGEKDVEQMTIIVHPGQAEEFRQRLKEIAEHNPDFEDIAPLGWAMEQVLSTYERLASGQR
ncbi:ParB N-terminal domain-containing protein [Alicyclobacillus fastidiosus]|uniref:ParB N-terminal domain-containing protein n=1 Tax=Alicyclobacillus fastidiosus TaxID=392011 RepID=A0ABV5ALD6_9BACL|nr:ParB N-terminal domain-containing protein [Alicyclobacillus fastidiosus]WEH08494.1 ParB N-terminal domain-containing protein [Alicyclobacillus fastidiosus]